MHELQIGPDRVVGRMIDTIDFHAAAKEILIRLHPGLTTPQLPASRLIYIRQLFVRLHICQIRHFSLKEGDFMVKVMLWISIPVLIMWPLICPAAEVPHELAGFILGGKIDVYMQRLKLDTVLPVRYLESLKEVETEKLRGYKTGLVSYATCLTPPRIVRLKFKYADSSKAFYDQLLQRFKARFSEPDEYRGDPFHIVVAWKWSFKDENNNDISLILQHNTKDEEEKQGNSVKMTMWNLLKEEMRCFEEKHPEAVESERSDFRYDKNRPVDWEHFIPH